MHYENVTLRDRGEVLAVYFKDDSILDQKVIVEIGGEFGRIAKEIAEKTSGKTYARQTWTFQSALACAGHAFLSAPNEAISGGR